MDNRFNAFIEALAKAGMTPDRAAVLIDQMLIINRLRSRECDSVTILCDNPESFGPANAIEVNGLWTDFKDVRFVGASLLEALSAADAAYEKANRPERGLLMGGPFTIFLNGDDTGLQASGRDEAVKMLSVVLIRRGNFNATPEAVSATFQQPMDGLHFVWPPGSCAIMSKGGPVRRKPRRRK